MTEENKKAVEQTQDLQANVWTRDALQNAIHMRFALALERIAGALEVIADKYERSAP